MLLWRGVDNIVGLVGPQDIRQRLAQDKIPEAQPKKKNEEKSIKTETVAEPTTKNWKKNWRWAKGVMKASKMAFNPLQQHEGGTVEVEMEKMPLPRSSSLQSGRGNVEEKEGNITKKDARVGKTKFEEAKKKEKKIKTASVCPIFASQETKVNDLKEPPFFPSESITAPRTQYPSAQNTPYQYHYSRIHFNYS